MLLLKFIVFNISYLIFFLYKIFFKLKLIIAYYVKNNYIFILLNKFLLNTIKIKKLILYIFFIFFNYITFFIIKYI